MSDHAASRTERKLPLGSFSAAASPIALPISISVSPKARVSCSGRIVGCTIERTPGRGAWSPQLSIGVWSGRIRSALSLVSSGPEAVEITKSTFSRAAAKAESAGIE